MRFLKFPNQPKKAFKSEAAANRLDEMVGFPADAPFNVLGPQPPLEGPRQPFRVVVVFSHNFVKWDAIVWGASKWAPDVRVMQSVKVGLRDTACVWAGPHTRFVKDKATFEAFQAAGDLLGHYGEYETPWSLEDTRWYLAPFWAQAREMGGTWIVAGYATRMAALLQDALARGLVSTDQIEVVVVVMRDVWEALETCTTSANLSLSRAYPVLIGRGPARIVMVLEATFGKVPDLRDRLHYVVSNGDLTNGAQALAKIAQDPSTPRVQFEAVRRELLAMQQALVRPNLRPTRPPLWNDTSG